MMTETQFDDWFVKPLALLNGEAHGGFAVLMIALPLTERYLREKSGRGEGNLDDKFYEEFVNLFPELDVKQAKQFWECYRHGLLHQATFKKSKILPKARMTSRNEQMLCTINYDASENAFMLLTREYSDKIVEAIKTDFQTFLAKGSPNHPTLQVTYPPFSQTSSEKTGPTDDHPPATGVPPA